MLQPQVAGHVDPPAEAPHRLLHRCRHRAIASGHLSPVRHLSDPGHDVFFRCGDKPVVAANVNEMSLLGFGLYREREAEVKGEVVTMGTGKGLA